MGTGASFEAALVCCCCLHQLLQTLRLGCGLQKGHLSCCFLCNKNAVPSYEMTILQAVGLKCNTKTELCFQLGWWFQWQWLQKQSHATFGQVTQAQKPTIHQKEGRQHTHTHCTTYAHTHSLSLASTHTYHSQWDILSFVAFIGFFDFVFSHSCIYFLPHTLPYTHPYISMDAHAHPHSTHTQTHPHTVSTDTKIPSLTSTCPPC